MGYGASGPQGCDEKETLNEQYDGTKFDQVPLNEVSNALIVAGDASRV